MATVGFLEDALVLKAFGVPIKHPNKIIRHLTGTERCFDWVKDVFDTNPPSPDGLEETPRIQLYSRFKQFLSGKELVFDKEFHPLRPGDKNIWEITTADVRIFGFFSERDVFVGIVADYAWRVKLYGLYTGYRDEVESFRYYHSVPYVKENGVYDVLS